MKIRKAKSKLFTNADIFYVPSKSGGDEHIVVQVDGRFFCDCKDFMTRRLPLLGTSAFTQCTHIKQVTRSIRIAEPAVKYGVFMESYGRSKDLPGMYDTRKEAEKAVEQWEKLGHDNGYYVEEL
jgi:hypothetical protein